MTHQSLDAVSPERRAQIQSLLQQTARDHDVQILLAVESGSRAWNMHSSDSDYDVRFVYMHKPDWYIATGQQRDVIDFPVSNDLDLHGWDIRKALGLLAKGNTTLLEWLNSPVRYIFHPEFSRKVRFLVPDYFVHAAYINHFKGLGLSHYKKLTKTKDFVSAKKLFYAVRPALMLTWLCHHSDPYEIPLDIERQLKESSLEDDLRSRIAHALEIKRDGPEAGKILRDKIIENWLYNVLHDGNHYQKLSKLDDAQQISIDRFLWQTVRDEEGVFEEENRCIERYEPNVLSIHEALHMAWFLMDSFERQVCAHSFVEYDPECRAQASRAFDELFKMYQLLGNKSDV